MNEWGERDKRTHKGYSWTTSDGHVFLQRCHKCGRENYGAAVATGVCVWCGHDEKTEGE